MCNEFVYFTFVKPFTTNLLGKNGLVWFCYSVSIYYTNVCNVGYKRDVGFLMPNKNYVI